MRTLNLNLNISPAPRKHSLQQQQPPQQQNNNHNSLFSNGINRSNSFNGFGSNNNNGSMFYNNGYQSNYSPPSSPIIGSPIYQSASSPHLGQYPQQHQQLRDHQSTSSGPVSFTISPTPLRKKASLGSLGSLGPLPQQQQQQGPIQRPPPLVIQQQSQPQLIPQQPQQQQRSLHNAISTPPNTPNQNSRAPIHSHSDPYLQKYAQQSNHQMQAYQFRQNYIVACERAKVLPSQDLLRALKNHIRNGNNVFTRLSICHAQLDDNHVKLIVNAMKQARLTTLNEILFNHNTISDMGANLLAKHLYTNSECFTNITSLELFGNVMTDDCCKDMSQMLKINQNLKRLKLGDNKIGAVGAALLAEGLQNNNTLTQLHLGGNKIQVEGLQKICEMSLMNNTSLTSLGLRDNDVGPEGMKYLAKVLMQPNCALSDIQLKGNRIMAQGAVHLSQALFKNSSLKVLELQSNAIGAAGVQALCTALSQNRSVHALNFNDNDLSCEGAVAVATLLMKNPSITTLGLANNRIRKKGAVALAKALGTTFSASVLADEDLSDLQAVLAAEQDKALANSMVAVTGLDLGNNELGNAGAVALAQSLKSNTVLTSLDLRACEIHLKGILALAEMAEVNTTLRHLDLGSNYAKNSGAQAFGKVLSENKSLTRLCLTDNQIFHEGGEALAIGLQSNFTLRNFSYGGQGVAANRIDSQIRRIIDSIVNENKKHWELHQASGNVPLTYNSNNNYRFINITQTMARMRADQQQLDSDYAEAYDPTLEDDGAADLDSQLQLSSASFQAQQAPMGAAAAFGVQQLNNAQLNRPASPVAAVSASSPVKRANSLPAWFASPTQHALYLDMAKMDHRLEFLFTNKLLKAENPKFPGCYFIGNVINTLRKVFPDTPRNFDEVELVRFAFNNNKYYVHLSRELVKTQIKYVGNIQGAQQQGPNYSVTPSSPPRSPTIMRQGSFNMPQQQVHNYPQLHPVYSRPAQQQQFAPSQRTMSPVSADFMQPWFDYEVEEEVQQQDLNNLQF